MQLPFCFHGSLGKNEKNTHTQLVAFMVENAVLEESKQNKCKYCKFAALEWLPKLQITAFAALERLQMLQNTAFAALQKLRALQIQHLPQLQHDAN